MRITIIQDDGVVGVDGVFRAVDLSALPTEIRAIQFDTAKGAGHIEYDPGATIEVDVRDEDAELEAEAAADTPEAIGALKQILKTARVRRENTSIDDFAPYQAFVDLWAAAVPKPATAKQIEDADVAAKRAAALRSLDEKRLAQAMADPAAPQAVKDYWAAKNAV